MTVDPVRLVLVDDHALMREGIRTILQLQGDLDVVGQAGSGEEAIEVVRRERPDVVCMDVEMPGIGGLEATRRLVADPDVDARVLVLTTFDREDYLLAALSAGASGFLLKNSRPEQLAEGIRTIAAGDSLLSPEVTRAVIERAVAGGGTLPGAAEGATGGASPSAEASAAVGTLTERELEVLALLAQGLSNEEIAGRMFVGRATVKTHVSNVLMKLALRDRVQAVAFAYRHGLVELG
ncbi:response regulator [Litorihabitans aurantiacus]|uniref:DNA-binding response regulator n=1 Tax=Litorihabitans aurantiacus TaxID=1930061 RepID=A0AA37XFH5_9MICO|nr:response regulator transcription factor [Litorihabitans aurantiacus]GMA32209.1 DNA-binding response regulator [Litorihabitans aurantiacus]